MLQINESLNSGGQYDDRLVLPFERRQRSRQRVTLASGTEAALMLERGTRLRDGDRLRGDDGRTILVVAASEAVMQITAPTTLLLMRAAYHLGNRHVALQIGDGWLRAEQDHVLRDMLLGLGAAVLYEEAPFEPEAGAYGGGHRHTHGEALTPPLPFRLSHHHD